jgi:hypothetical protein
MKIFKRVLVLFLTVLFCFSCSAQTIAKNNVFGLGTSLLAVVVGNNVKFYNGSNNWSEMADLEFTLPNGYKNAFGLGTSLLAVVVDNKIKFYNGSNNWSEMGDLEFNID